MAKDQQGSFRKGSRATVSVMGRMGWWLGVSSALLLSSSTAFAAGGAVAPSTTLGAYAVLALDKVTLRTGVEVDPGDVGANAASGAVALMARAHVSGSVAGNTIQIGSKATASQLFCTTLDRQRPNPLQCAAMTLPLVDAASLPTVQVDAGKDDIRLSRLGTMGPVAPGAYGIVRLGERATLTLAGGEYQIRSLWLGNGASVVCQAACHISVVENVVMKDNAILGPLAPLDATAVRVDIKGGGRTAGFRAYRASTVDATVYAPNGGVVLGMRGRYTGEFIGKTVFVYQNAHIKGLAASTP
jgi:hypothetical protein